MANVSIELAFYGFNRLFAKIVCALMRRKFRPVFRNYSAVMPEWLYRASIGGQSGGFPLKTRGNDGQYDPTEQLLFF
jgi:hypothetical protein